MKMRHIESDIKIYVTKDYELFHNFKENRDIRWSHVQKITNWINKEDLRIPIIIDEAMHVIDGQHTLEARKKLKLPIYYIIEDKATAHRSIVVHNAQRKNWVLTDYIDFYTRSGNKEYMMLNKYMNEWNLAAWQVIYILRGGKKTDLESIKEGKFKVIISNPETLKHLSNFILEIVDNSDSRRLFKEHGRILCNWFIVNPTGNFEPAIFLKKFRQHLKGTKITWSSNAVAFKRQVEDIYNRNTHYKKRLFG
jgi:hypothetical protein